MDTAPLVIDEIEAGKALIERLNNYAPVRAAAWLREEGRRYPRLYVALEGVTPETWADANKEVWRLVNEMTDHYLDTSSVVIMAPSDPIAKALVDFQDKYPRRSPARYDQSYIGHLQLEETYVYQRLPAKP